MIGERPSSKWRVGGTLNPSQSSPILSQSSNFGASASPLHSSAASTMSEVPRREASFASAGAFGPNGPSHLQLAAIENGTKQSQGGGLSEEEKVIVIQNMPRSLRCRTSSKWRCEIRVPLVRCQGGRHQQCVALQRVPSKRSSRPSRPRFTSSTTRRCWAVGSVESRVQQRP